MSALTVTLGADITALKRAMTAAGDLVASSARRMNVIKDPQENSEKRTDHAKGGVTLADDQVGEDRRDLRFP